MKNKNLISTMLLITLFSVLSFFAGQKMPGKKSLQGFDRAQFGSQGQTRGGGLQGGQNQMRGGGQILGEIISVDSDKITIKQTDGSSKVILINGETSVVKSSPSTLADLKVGTKIAVFGKANTDALISAQSIQVDPQNRMMASPSATPKR